MSTDSPAISGPYAIVETSGTQVWVQPNRYYDLDRIHAEVDSTLTLENVLLVNDGKAASVGQPFVKGATVELQVMAHRRGPKVIVYKMRPKKKTRRKNGHRQELTRVLVTAIQVGGKAIA
jgi:large subunit ribosomal protein L21